MSDPFADLSQLQVGALHQTFIGQAIAAKQPFQERYKILKVLGRGSFGITFLAQDIHLPGKLQCVIKLLAPITLDPKLLPAIQQRFEQEARMLATLGGHPQIPLLLDYFELGGEFYLVQEYIRGATLAKLVETQGPLKESKVRRLLKKVLPLLHYIHEHQVIHRDIKPENLIRCEEDGRIVLIDFGSVKELLQQPNLSSDDSSTLHTYVVGTHGFMPPEQLQRQPVYASDIYALGMTCLYLLTGSYPWDLKQGVVDATQLIETEFKVTQAFAAILRQMTALSLRERHCSAQEVLTALEHLEANYPLVQTNQLLRLKQTGSGRTQPTQLDSSYVSPAVRLATGIRGWKQRLLKRPFRR